MKNTNLNQGIAHLLDRYKFLDSVKVIPTTSLFPVEPEWSKLKELRCPVCANKLKFPRSGKIAMCAGKKHGDRRPFIIKLETLAKISK